MTKEAMKLALEALEQLDGIDTETECVTFDVGEAITALREALAEQPAQQEPVAWIHNFIEGGISIGKRPADLERHPDRWTALYKDPKPCPTCEALARTVMLDQTSHDTSPTAQRTWVGLTDEDVMSIAFNFDVSSLSLVARAIEAKLKEKNT